MSELNEYQQRLEDIITIAKVKDFDMVNSKQMRGLMALFIKCQLQQTMGWYRRRIGRVR
jgi:hypothetical protein